MDDKKVEEFLKEIEEVCKKHNMSISHEDHQGAFIIEEFKDKNIKQLKGAEVQV